MLVDAGLTIGAGLEPGADGRLFCAKFLAPDTNLAPKLGVRDTAPAAPIAADIPAPAAAPLNEFLIQ